MLIFGIGAGYVGATTCAIIAANTPHKVVVFDIDERRIDGFANAEVEGDLPFYEEGLFDVLQMARQKGNLTFTSSPDLMKTADIIFVSVNTPTKSFGLGIGYAADLTLIERAANAILSNFADVHPSAGSQPRKVYIVEKSTVPVRTAETLRDLLKHPAIDFRVLSNPEFLAEGTAIYNLQHPDRVIIGGDVESQSVLADVYAEWVPRERIITTDSSTSELSKLAANAMLAQRVSSVNALAMVCEGLWETSSHFTNPKKRYSDVGDGDRSVASSGGPSISDVSKCLSLDPRIGSRFLQPSLGFGGSCFQKDILSLVYIAKSLHLNEVADYFESILKINDVMKVRFGSHIVKSTGTVTGKRIGLLGFAFKKHTGDCRETPAVDIANMLLNERAIIKVIDPYVDDGVARAEIKRRSKVKIGTLPVRDVSSDNKSLTFTKSMDVAEFVGLDILVVITDHDQFVDLDYRAIRGVMGARATVFDGRGVLDEELMRSLGYQFGRIGSKYDRISKTL